MTPSTVDRLRALVTTVLHVEAPDPSADLIDGGLLDSLGLVELLAAMELEFDVEIPLDEIELDHVRTLDRLADLAAQRIALKAPDAA